jgi:hypothetical protein
MSGVSKVEVMLMEILISMHIKISQVITMKQNHEYNLSHNKEYTKWKELN